MNESVQAGTAARAAPGGEARPGAGAESGRAPARRWAGWRYVRAVCAASALVHPTASALSRRSWLADLISHFQGPALVVTAAAALVALAARGRRLAVGLGVLAALQVAPLVRYDGANPVPPDPKSPERLRVVMINLLDTNDRYDRVEALIRAESPDVVGLVEYTRDWVRGLRAVREGYPYRMEYPAGSTGLALWFRERPRSIGPPEWLAPGTNPVLHAAFDFAGRERHLWLVHPQSPLEDQRRWEPGNAGLGSIAERVRATGGSRIVVGDLNSTDGSAHFRDLLSVTGLRDSRLGFGRQESWPDRFPLRIAIDHLLLSDDLAVAGRQLGPRVGSDHFPLIVDLAPAAATKAATQGAQPPSPSP